MPRLRNKGPMPCRTTTRPDSRSMSVFTLLIPPLIAVVGTVSSFQVSLDGNSNSHLFGQVPPAAAKCKGAASKTFVAPAWSPYDTPGASGHGIVPVPPATCEVCEQNKNVAPLALASVTDDLEFNLTDAVLQVRSCMCCHLTSQFIVHPSPVAKCDHNKCMQPLSDHHVPIEPSNRTFLVSMCAASLYRVAVTSSVGYR